MVKGARILSFHPLLFEPERLSLNQTGYLYRFPTITNSNIKVFFLLQLIIPASNAKEERSLLTYFS
jgi:hypothetical protein